MDFINLSSFQLITSKYGSEEGGTYFDEEESLAHDILPDRIIFYTNYLDYRSYEVYIHEGVLHVKKTRLDNYKLHDKAKVIEDTMDEEDHEELDQLWKRMEQDLVHT
ncbi:hypothetical protein L3C95_27230 [Chitinophaga filiformis]|uniref:hypothetical protein n=1 Tax=Chitinophaga filiformis TaxID=104663 RepID=UPI001F1C6BFE|nr:hypothetical protein [Chitinophaga filiformis]MCF6406621.1 hypothetical protein [Chitinophaga filiformis]